MSGWTILSELVRILFIMSATGSVIAVLFFCLRAVIKHHFPKSIQYYLWVIVWIAFLVPFSTFITVPFSTPMLPIQEVVQENVKTTAERREEISQEQYGVEYSALNAQVQIEIAYNAIGLFSSRANDFLLAMLLAFGGVNFLGGMVQYSIYISKLNKWRKGATAQELALLNQLCRNKKAPRLYRSSMVSTPMLTGLFHPAIYLPDIEYTKEQTQNILLHELTHWRRHDVVIKWMSALAVYVHWFNPIVYLVCKEMDRCCELACDEAVIGNLDTNGKQSYGDTLIAMASDAKVHKIMVSTTMCEQKKALKERLGEIMKSKAYTKKIMILSFVLLAVAALSVVLLGGAANRGNSGSAKAYDTFSFSNLQPTQTEIYKDDLTFVDGNAQFDFSVTWTPSGLPVGIGLRAQDGTEYLAEIIGGSAAGSIKDIPAGTYQVFLHNDEKNFELKKTRNNLGVSGAVAFSAQQEKSGE